MITSADVLSRSTIITEDGRIFAAIALSLRCLFLDPGIHQVIIKIDSKGYSLALA